MKKQIPLLIGFFLIPSSLLYGQSSAPIDIVIESVQKELESKEIRYKSLMHNDEMYRKNIPLFKERAEKARLELRRSQFAYENYDSYLSKLKEFVEREEGQLNTFQRIGSRKKRLLDCLNNGFEAGKYPDVKSCRAQYKVDFPKKDQIYLNELEKVLSSHRSEHSKKAKEAENEIVKNEELLANYQKSQLDAEKNGYLASTISDIEALKKRVKDLSTIKNDSSFYKCSPDMKTIDLEEEQIYPGSNVKGPFYNVKRDNQDGLGTCYANTAKNFMVALSGGKMVGSFLDMALQYKIAENDYLDSGLDGGHSCRVLNHLRQKGICDQKFAPTEQGDSNEVIESLLSSKYDSMQTQANIIESLKNFLKKKDTLLSEKASIRDLFLNDPKNLISQIKENSHITFPLPIVNHTIGGNAKLHNLFVQHNPERKSIELEKLKKEVIEYDEKFKPTYIQLAISNASLDKVIDAYQGGFLDILKKFKMEAAYDVLLQDYKQNMSFHYTEENRQKLYDSIAFIHGITKKEDVGFEKFAASCIEVFKNGINFIENFAPLIKSLEVYDIPADRIIAGEDFKDDIELFYLAVAPSCMNEENRTKVDFDFSCTGDMISMNEFKGKFGEDKEAMKEGFRARIVRNLVNGMPVGNSFAESRGNHINTIVGVRYNPETNKCDYKIRESQNGRSDWHEESPIVERMYELTEIERL